MKPDRGVKQLVILSNAKNLAVVFRRKALPSQVQLSMTA